MRIASLIWKIQFGVKMQIEPALKPMWLTLRRSYARKHDIRITIIIKT